MTFSSPPHPTTPVYDCLCASCGVIFQSSNKRAVVCPTCACRGGREADTPPAQLAALARALIPEFGPAATRRILRILANFGVLGGRPPSGDPSP